MKVCLVSDQLVGYHKTWSGAELVCQYVAGLLQEENQEVIFITTEFSRKNSFQSIFQVPALNIAPSLIKPVARILGIIRSFNYLRREKPDVVHFFHSNFLFIPVMIAARILGIPTVFTVLDYFIICSKNNLRMSSGELCNRAEGRHCSRCILPLKFLERLIIRFLLKYLDGIITFTETSKSRLIRHGVREDKIRVIYTYNPFFGVSADSQKEESKPVLSSILFVGTFFEYKGLHILIKAVSRVISKVAGAKLMVTGMGYEQDKVRIEKLIGDLKIGDHIEFLGHKKNDEIMKLICESEVVAVPEQWPSDFGPLVLVEAQALAKPVVAGNIGAIPEFVRSGENGFLAEYDNPEQFAEKIIWLLKNKSAAGRMGEQAKSDIQIFLKSNQGKEMVKLYNEIISGIKT